MGVQANMLALSQNLTVRQPQRLHQPKHGPFSLQTRPHITRSSSLLANAQPGAAGRWRQPVLLPWPQQRARLVWSGTAVQAVSVTALGQPEELSRPIADSSLFRSQHDWDILKLAIPALGSIMLDPLMGLVDTAIVGRLGAAPLGAVGLATIVNNFSAFAWSFFMTVTNPKVAAFIAKGDRDGASRTTAQGLWVAFMCGCGTAAAMWYGAPYAMRGMGASAEILPLAVSYLRCRAIASPAALCLYVATGSLRGHRDTTTPLIAAVASNMLNFGLDFLLIFGLGWGVAGAALATSASQYAALLVMGGMLLRKGILQPAHLTTIPRWSAIRPLLVSGMSLSARNLTSMAAILYATSMVGVLGTTATAAHEILRQVWLFSIQAFASLDIAAQSLVATYLGKENIATARQVLLRTMQLGTAVGAGMTALLLCTRGGIPAIFSSDAAVLHMAQQSMPLIALCMPLDALASIMDGGLLGAQDTGYVARGMIFSSTFTVIALVLTQRFTPGLLGVWASLKCITLGRIITGSLRLTSAKSPFASPASRVADDEQAAPAPA